MSRVLLAGENKSLFLSIFVEGVGRNEEDGWGVDCMARGWWGRVVRRSVSM